MSVRVERAVGVTLVVAMAAEIGLGLAMGAMFGW
jgi:hypothetical protein